jgi:uncharacterized protein (TIGR02757 family)
VPVVRAPAPIALRPRARSSAWARVPAARRDAIGRALTDVAARCDVDARRAADPVGLVHAYRDPADVEVAGLVAACLAFGNARTIVAKVSLVLDRLGPHPARTADDAALVRARLRDVKHRVYRGDDIARLVLGARRVQRADGSLGQRFAQELARAGTLRDALDGWAAAIRRAGGLDRAARTHAGARHILPDPGKASGCKRLLLYLRWMVRPADGVDLGLWSEISPAILLVPVDTHLFKLSQNLGLTGRRTLDWTTAEEITGALRTFDAADPVRFDFALCHLGMVQRCPSRRDPQRCVGCGVQSVCRHWAGRSSGLKARMIDSTPLTAEESGADEADWEPSL